MVASESVELAERAETLARLQEALQAGNLREAKELAGLVRPPEVLEIWEELSAEEHFILLEVLPPQEATEVLSNLELEDQVELLRTIPPLRAAELLARLAPDDLADLAGTMREDDPELAELLFKRLPLEVQDQLARLTEYQEDEAGGLMTPDFVALRAEMTVDQVLRFLRRAGPDAETVYYLYVVDSEQKLLGVLSLRDLIVAPLSTRVQEIMKPDAIYVHTDTDQEEVAHLMRDYDLSVLPVVDESERLVGIVTIDDVLDVIEEEVTEDIYRLGAVEAPDLVYSRSSVTELWLARVRWLFVLVVAGVFTSSILAGFESVLAAVTALSFYIPVLLGTGGNTGNQSATLIIRALATRDLEPSDWLKVLGKEVAVGLLLGAVLATLIAIKVIFDGNTGLTWVVALSLLALVLVANLVGALLPLLLRRLGVDPALISNPLVATASDLSGLLIYLAVARYLLDL